MRTNRVFQINGFWREIKQQALTRREPDYPCTWWRRWCWTVIWTRVRWHTLEYFSAPPSWCDTSIGWRSCCCLSSNCWWWIHLYFRLVCSSFAHRSICFDGPKAVLIDCHLRWISSASECVLIAEWPWLAAGCFLSHFFFFFSSFPDSLISQAKKLSLQFDIKASLS